MYYNKGFKEIFAFLVTFIVLYPGPTNSFGQIVNNEMDSVEVEVFTYKIKGRTATGHSTWKVPHPFIAISRDLVEIFPLHSYVELTNCRWAGKYQVLDLMGKKHQKTIDIFYKGSKKINTTQCLCKPVKEK